MNPIIQFNRETLKSVPNWIKDEDYASPPSLYNYGLPPRVYHLINLDVSNEPTECDVICFILRQFMSEQIPIRYLEIGCSVGKTFYQISKFVYENTEDFSVSCLDIEAINPILNDLLTGLMKETSTTVELYPNLDPSCEIQKDKNKIVTWNNGSKTVQYYESNSFDKDIWKKMNVKYNFIFSDACHHPSALMNEYVNLKENQRIDLDHFVYCFDDLGADMNHCWMWESVKNIYQDLKHTTGKDLCIKHFVVNGWLGKNEAPHHFGVISSFDISLA